MFCREWIVVKRSGDMFSAAPLHCRAWTCEVCQPKRSRELVADARAGGSTLFLTITANPEWPGDNVARARRMVEGWREYRRRHRRWWGKDEAEFFAVFEATKQGQPHLHVLLRGGFFDQHELSRWFDFWMGAPIVWVRRVWGPKGISVYLTKYVGKGPHKFGTLKRYWFSRRFRVVPRDTKPLDPAERGWPTVKETDLGTWQHYVECQGAFIHQEAPQLVYSFTVPP